MWCFDKACQQHDTPEQKILAMTNEGTKDVSYLANDREITKLISMFSSSQARLRYATVSTIEPQNSVIEMPAPIKFVRKNKSCSRPPPGPAPPLPAYSDVPEPANVELDSDYDRILGTLMFDRTLKLWFDGNTPSNEQTFKLIFSWAPGSLVSIPVSLIPEKGLVMISLRLWKSALTLQMLISLHHSFLLLK